MEGLRERNSNIVRTHKKPENSNAIVVSSHASSHTRATPMKSDNVTAESKPAGKVGLDEEEMLFLARRCLAEELKSRPVVAAVLSERSRTPEVVVHEIPVVVPDPVAPVVVQYPPVFQLQRLGFGLIVLKFGWIWVSCGGLIMADSFLCTGDIFSIVFKRLTQHMFKVGDRLGAATRQTRILFTNN